MSDNVLPVTIVAVPSIGVAGKQVEFTLTMSKSAATDQAVTITATAGFFSDIPTQVTVQAGNDSVQFDGQVADDATGIAYVTAACNGGQVQTGLTAALSLDN